MDLTVSRMAARRGIPRGERTRQEILKVAVDVASAEGLEGLTIGRLADELKMSKAGLLAHFGTKEELQLATVDAARAIFVSEVVEPSVTAERGLVRLQAMLESWLSYVERSIFRGGCFFFAASAEMDDRPGRVHDLVAELTKAWVNALEEEVRQAQALSQLAANCDPEFLAFQLHAFVQEANWYFRLHSDRRAFAWARAAIRRGLEMAATPTGLRIVQGKKAAAKKVKSKSAR
jgi:AcrR family transcriptional regulator